MQFAFTIEFNLLLPCFGLLALYMRIYCNSWPSPPAQYPSSTAGVSKVQFEGRRATPLPFFLLAVTYYIIYMLQINAGHTQPIVLLKQTCKPYSLDMPVDYVCELLPIKLSKVGNRNLEKQYSKIIPCTSEYQIHRYFVDAFRILIFYFFWSMHTCLQMKFHKKLDQYIIL